MNQGLIPKIYKEIYIAIHSAVKFTHVPSTAKSLNERRQPAGVSKARFPGCNTKTGWSTSWR
jgi:hypothetical protein